MSGMPSRRTVLAGIGALTAGGMLARPGLAWALPPVPPDEDGYELWLRYRQVDDEALLAAYRGAFTHVVGGPGTVVASAAGELARGLTGLLGQPVAQQPAPTGPGAVVVGTRAGTPLIAQQITEAELAPAGQEGYLIRRHTVDGNDVVLVAAATERGALYGAFALLRHAQTHRPVEELDATEWPALPLRLVNHWDNLDRSVERGYAGLSVFDWASLPEVLPRYPDYARTLASVGVNGTVVNNVNASPEFLSDEMIGKLTGLAQVLREWGIALYLSANFASPILLDGLGTADPFDDGVRAWWRSKVDAIYAAIPDFGGFLVKANSEGQPGPGDYGRTHADGANMFAEALAPHGGIVVWRAFIHDFNPTTWAGKAYQTFQPLDGKFADNAIVQIKNGPIDFQVREPVHPLFGALPNTNSMVELQITQEYTGQATHLCYLVPEWKEIYAFDTHAAGTGPTVAEVVDGSAFGYSRCGAAGVMNFGDDRDWTRHQLAAANTHGYARLAWNPGLAAEAVADEWVRMTYGNDPDVGSVITGLLLGSWPTYESYASPLGCGFMIWGGDHFDPDPPAAQRFHGADDLGVGFDRTVASGTGDTALYFPPLREEYESLADCPDELLLFFHHVPYDHRLDSGATVIQHIYTTHFAGRDAVLAMRERWNSLRDKVDAARLADTLERFDRQVAHATVWRDTLAAYFFEKSRILAESAEWMQVRFVDPAPVLLAGVPSRVDVQTTNATRGEAEAVVRVETPEGWAGDAGRITLASGASGLLTLGLTTSGAVADLVTLRVTAESAVEVLTGTAARTAAIIAPAGQNCVLALDVGTGASPVQSSYAGLGPNDAWSAQRGFGWVGGAPQSRDRGGRLDPLRRDFCNDTTARVLRVAVPAGTHEVYLLVSDNLTMHPTYVHSGGTLLAQSEFLLDGGATWLRFSLDGGAGGAEIDLRLSGDPREHWHLNALTILPAP